jgi:hypothetical protein
MENQLLFEHGSTPSFYIASDGRVAPVVIDAQIDESVHIAAATFADDIERVTGRRPQILTERSSSEASVIEVRVASKQDQPSDNPLVGQWESFSIKADADGRTLAVTGSDKVGSTLLYNADVSARGNICFVHLIRTYGRFPLVLVVRCTRTTPINHRVSVQCDLSPWPTERQVSWSLSQR